MYSLTELAKNAQQNFASEIVAATVNNQIRDLQIAVAETANIDFIELNSINGWKIYQRSILFLLYAAVHKLYPEAEVIAKFTANKGLFAEINLLKEPLNEKSVAKIEEQMRKFISADLPIIKETLPREDAVKLFKDSKQIEKANLIAALKQSEVSIYHLGDFYDYLYGAMLGKTKSLAKFALDFEPPGLLLRTPDMGTRGKVRARIPQPKLSHILSESKEWAAALQCNYVPDLNRINRQGYIGDVIRISEALQEKRIARIADFIASNKHLRLILIAGPSSSGKTSFAQRLKVQLRVNRLNPVSISLDDYFCNRVDTPKNERGEYDYENLHALDTKLFNENMLDLLAGKEIILPRYNFITGMREWQTENPLVISPSQPIIVEGIHGLNEELSRAVPRENKYKIYVSALTQLNIDAHNRIPTTDARLIRRLVRDYQFRGAYALKTLKQWGDVRAGEEKNIFPYQEEADVMFNSALIYELGILKKYAEPLLEKISPDIPEHAEAKRLLDILQYFDDIDAEDEVPNNSILREFIGKSVFFK